MTIDTDVKITINLSELVNIRSVVLKLDQEDIDTCDIENIANELRTTLTWDTLYSMVDSAILEYIGESQNHYGERTIETVEITMEKERKAREKEFKKNFDMVKLKSSSWEIDVPLRKDR